MWRYMLTLFSVLIVVKLVTIQAASTYSYSQANSDGNRFQNYPFQQRQHSPLQADIYNYGYQNNYPYARPDESAINQRNNYAYIQPTEPSQAQTQFELPRGQLQQQQRLPFWMDRQIIADFSNEQYNPATTTRNMYPSGYQSIQNDAYNRKPLHSDFTNWSLSRQSGNRFMPYTDESYFQQSQIGSPSSRDLALLSVQNSVVPLQANRYATPPDYDKHFERYLRKYPERLQPSYV